MELLRGFVAWFDRGNPERFRSLGESRNVGEASGVLGPEGALFGLYGHSSSPSSQDGTPCVIDPCGLVACRGFLANRREVVSDLSDPALADASLGEIVLASYEQWGPQFSRRWTGEFSFVLFDRNDGKVIAARDALGIKKLFLYRESERTWIGSHLELILAFLPRIPPLDAAELSHTVHCGFFSDHLSATVYRGVTSLLPGHSVVFEPDGREKIERVWSGAEGEELDRLDDRQIEEQFRERLFDAVEGTLPGSGSILSELSGGLDSSSVSAVAANVLGRRGEMGRLKTVSYLSSASDAEERNYQLEFTAHSGIQNECFRFIESLVVSELTGEQALGLHSFQRLTPPDRLAMKGLGAKVCLTGQGGDAVLGHFQEPFFLADLFSLRTIGRWRRAMGRYLAQGDFGLFQLLQMSLRRQGREVDRPSPGWLRGDVERSNVERGQVGSLVTSRTPARAELRRDLLGLAPHLVDSPRSEIEFRHPLLDRSLVEFCLRLPWESLAQAGQSRILQRRVLSPFLPSSIVDRLDKADFTPGAIHCFRTMVEGDSSLARGARLAELGVIEPSEFSKSLDRALHGICSPELPAVFSAVLFEAWLSVNPGGRAPREDLGEVAEWVREAARSEVLGKGPLEWASETEPGRWERSPSPGGSK